MCEASYTIRRLTPNDIESISAFFARIDRAEYRVNFAPHPFDSGEAQRVAAHEGQDLYVGIFTSAGAPDPMVGYGMLRGLDAGYEIPSLGLCVLKESRRKGLGSRLLQHLLDACRARGAEQVMLKVRAENRTARALYEDAGFIFRERNAKHLIGRRNLERDK